MCIMSEIYILQSYTLSHTANDFENILAKIVCSRGVKMYLLVRKGISKYTYTLALLLDSPMENEWASSFLNSWLFPSPVYSINKYIVISQEKCLIG